MDELKPCPFCGCKAITDSEQRHSGTKDKFYFVGCSAYDCIASLHSMNHYFVTEEEAAKAWNRRANDGRKAAD